MRHNRILKTGLVERLEELHRQFPACEWLREIDKLNGKEKDETEPGNRALYLDKGIYYIYKNK